MRTEEAARGKWHMIFEHYGLPTITGKTHYKGECPVWLKELYGISLKLKDVDDEDFISDLCNFIERIRSILHKIKSL